MAQFDIKIERQDAIDAGFADPGEGFFAYVTFDKGLNRSPKFQVLNAQFGDGYEQRIQDGINIKRETFRAAFAKRPAAEVNKIAKLLDNKAAEALTLIISEQGAPAQEIKAVCDDYNIVYIHELYHSMTANFRRVYEA